MTKDWKTQHGHSVGAIFNPRSGFIRCQLAHSVCSDCTRQLLCLVRAAWAPWTIRQHLLWLGLTFTYTKFSQFWWEQEDNTCPYGISTKHWHWDLGENPRSGCSFFWIKRRASGCSSNKQRILIAMKKAHCQVATHLEELSKFRI